MWGRGAIYAASLSVEKAVPISKNKIFANAIVEIRGIQNSTAFKSPVCGKNVNEAFSAVKISLVLILNVTKYCLSLQESNAKEQDS